MNPITRRDVLHTVLPALALGGLSLEAMAQAAPTVDGKGGSPLADAVAAGFKDGQYALPPLPYAPDALEPHIDAQTMQLHHGKHHAAYVNNLNRTLKALQELRSKPADQVDPAQLSALQRDVSFNAGGHVLHTVFWSIRAPKAGGAPTGAIAEAITGTFGSFDKFKELFTQAAMTRFGSGWAWLSDEKGKLVIHSTANQDTPSMEGKRAIFGLDVWEHAYYLKYQNRRADYLAALQNVINWDFVSERYSQLVK